MSLSLYNTLTRTKEEFQPLHPPQVGVYLCGPTVYNEAHLGNARGPVVFDVLTRYLRHSGYLVRYVRNITDVGHLQGDSDNGEDPMAKAARAQQLEPMQVAQYYTNRYRLNLAALGCIPPDIEPQASGHITEQIAMVQEIMANGFAYEVNGSVYFDVARYNTEYRYGQLSNRVTDELLAGTRDNLAGQDEKRSPVDFALWKSADATHLMRWPSPWGMGFPGWHIECSAMSRKYLGTEFDIHGGGLDNMFPHHECEIAQSQASHNRSTEARVWIHNNMLTVNGAKMSKSLGNFITLPDLFAGSTGTLSQAYSPMVVRFFLLQAHYRSPIDLTDDALQAARKGYRKLMNGLRLLDKLDALQGEIETDGPRSGEAEKPLFNAIEAAYAALDNDLNTAQAVARLFDLLRQLNTYATKPELFEALDKQKRREATAAYRTLVADILGLRDEPRANAEQLLELTLGFYAEAKAEKAYDKVDHIRAALKGQGIVIKDTKAGVEWAYSED